MDLEELNTTQIILLVLLVSFVTSIATGIVTVSLLAQAPPAVTQTVNHIIERTVETVAPSGGAERVVTKETTVVVKEEDLMTKSIAEALSQTGRIFSGTSTSSPVVAFAVPIAPNLLATDGTVVGPEHLVQFGSDVGVYSVSVRFPEVGIALLTPKSASTTAPAPFHISDTGSVKLGASAIALVSITNERVALGAVTARALLADVRVDSGSTTPVRVIDTSILDPLVPGSPLVNVFGDLVGITTAVSKGEGGNGAFVSISDIVTALSLVRATSTPSR
ncbi:MAG: hypothetical protein AAB923_03480 [Patescibacteria group bacterium]